MSQSPAAALTVLKPPSSTVEGVGSEDGQERADIEAARIATQGSPYLTTKQAAFYLGFSAASVHAMRRKGRGPRFVRFGRAVRYHVRDLTDYVQRRAGSENANV